MDATGRTNFTARLNNSWVIGLLILALVVLVRLPSIQQSFDNDSGALAYHATLILHGEPLYTTHHPGHHLPGVYYLYAFVFGLFGNNTISLKIFLVAWVWLNAWVLFLIGRQAKGKITGVLAAVIFVLITASTAMAGDTGEIEMFANLPLTLTIWLGLGALKKHSSPIAFAWIGVFGAISFLFKANYLASMGSVGLGLFVLALLENQPENWQEFFKRVLAIFLGVLFILGPVLAYFLSVGATNGLLLVARLGTDYMTLTNSTPFAIIFLYAPIEIIVVNACSALIGFTSASAILLSLPRKYKSDPLQGIIEFILLLWLIASIVAAGISKLTFPHYALLVVPPFSVFFALAAARFFDDPGLQHQNLAKWLPRLGYALLVAVLANSLVSARTYISGYLQYITGHKSFSEFEYNDTLLGHDRTMGLQVAEYLRTHTSPADTIFNWSDEAEIYYYSNRRSSSDNLWPLDIPRLGPPERVLKTRPKYIVVGRSIFESATIPGWLEAEISTSYALETTVAGQKIFRRIAP